jgi:hypothetical protein
MTTVINTEIERAKALIAAEERNLVSLYWANIIDNMPDDVLAVTVSMIKSRDILINDWIRDEHAYRQDMAIIMDEDN